MGYDTAALIDRITLKAFTSTSSSLTSQQILDLADDSLRSYIVPLTKTLREEWWVVKDDIVLTTDANGAVAVPDSVASTLRTVAWDNAGILNPLTRIEPELSFQYLAMGGSLPAGFELRGYTLVVLPKVPGIQLHLTAMLRPPQMVLTSEAAQIESHSGTTLNLSTVPLEWQSTWPATVDIVSDVSPFSTVLTAATQSLVSDTLTLAPGTDTSKIQDSYWVTEVGTSPFANIPVELYPLLEQDVVAQLFQGLGDKRLKDVLQRKQELEQWAKRTMGPRTQGNPRPIVNPAAPGMRASYGFFPRR